MFAPRVVFRKLVPAFVFHLLIKDDHDDDKLNKKNNKNNNNKHANKCICIGNKKKETLILYENNGEKTNDLLVSYRPG